MASTAVIAWVLIEAFEAMVLPRRAMRKLRFNRWFYRVNWPIGLFVARALTQEER
jgi:hypothetical protein